MDEEIRPNAHIKNTAHTTHCTHALTKNRTVRARLTTVRVNKLYIDKLSQTNLSLVMCDKCEFVTFIREANEKQTQQMK